jgi:Ser/Thr protein kinase RdoA (MazF antagonist)
MATSPQLSTPIALGRTSEIYAWKDGYILKLYYDWCPPHWLEHEAHVARVIVAAGIPTPAVDEIVEIKGRRGIVYERVQGVSMLQDLNAHPWMVFRHARALANLQAQYQQLSVPELRGYRSSLGDSIRRAPHLLDAERAKMLELLGTLPDGDSLCHGDFHPGNVIISPHGPIVIDWMTAVSGSPWADVARTSLLLTVGPKAAGKQLSPFVRLFISLYHDTYLKHYQALRPDHQKELQRWLLVMAAARLDERIEPECETLIQMIRNGLQ